MNPFHISFDPSQADFWVGVGLLIFLGIVVFVAKAPQMIAGQLDAKRDTIQHDLDEAARIRAEAERLLAELKAERVEAEAQVRGMLAAAEERQSADCLLAPFEVPGEAEVSGQQPAISPDG
jgi:F0F1-type ATP synthase membrane subunit b/b'